MNWLGVRDLARPTRRSLRRDGLVSSVSVFGGVLIHPTPLLYRRSGQIEGPSGLVRHSASSLNTWWIDFLVLGVRQAVYRSQWRCHPIASISSLMNVRLVLAPTTIPGASDEIEHAWRTSTPCPHAAIVLQCRYDSPRLTAI